MANYLLQKNTILGNWKVISDSPFKRGGQSELYEVIQADDNSSEKYILKVYKEQKAHSRRTEFFNRFRNEVKALNILKNEEMIVKILDYQQKKDDKIPYYFIVMEKADYNLKEYLDKTQLDDSEIFKLYSMILEGIKSIHRNGIIHRDLKPQNILIKNSDIKIIDFGICFFLKKNENKINTDNRITKDLEAIGSRGYIAPESIGGRVEDIDFRYDIFTLGKILYFLLSRGKELTHIYFDADANRIGNLRNEKKYNVFNTFFKKTIAVDKAIRYKTVDHVEKGFNKCKSLFLNYKQLGIEEYNKIPLINSHILKEFEKLLNKPVLCLDPHEFTNDSFGFVEEYSRIIKLGLPFQNLDSLLNDFGILEELETLNLQGNVLIDLPKSLLLLKNIKKLDLSQNQINYLPQGFGKNQKKLIILNLSENHLRSIDSNYRYLENLKILKLNSNKLNHLYDVFGKLKNLEILSLSNNSISEIPSSIFNLSQLKRLDLSKNRLNHIPLISNLQNIEFLNFSSNKLTYIPNSIGKLSNLTTLNLIENELNDLPNEIEGLKKLKVLIFDSNMLSKLPVTFKNLTSLIFLSFKHNKFDNLPKAITSLKNLKHLDVAGNQIKTLPSNIGDLSKLESLNLFINQLENIPISFSNLKNLKVLHLGHNLLGNIPNFFNKLISLEKLALIRNRFYSNINSLENLQNLKELELSGNNLGVFPEWICKLSNLEGLWLIECSLTSILGCIESLENLLELRLEHNRIDSIPDSIGKLAQLKTLMLHNNKLQNIPKTIQNLDNLEYFYLGGNQIKEDENFHIIIQKLKNNGCKVDLKTR